MKVGVPKETKDNENRVGMTPAGVAALTDPGHAVVVERAAGVGCGFSDDDYRNAGARVAEVADAWDTDLVIKIKEPLEREFGVTVITALGGIVWRALRGAGIDDRIDGFGKLFREC